MNIEEKIKVRCDNDTLMYVFKNDPVGKAYNRNILFTPWKVIKKIEPTISYVESEDVDGNPIIKEETKVDWGINGLDPVTGQYYSQTNTYYNRHVMLRMAQELCVNIYYKNKNGVWVDYLRCIRSYPTQDIQVSSVEYEDIVKIDINVLPRCEFMDKEYFIHYIDEHDGVDNDTKVSNIEIDSNDQNVVRFEHWSIENPLLPSSAKHVMEDLKITLPSKYKRKNILVWLNGAFVPTVKDNTYENVFYIKYGALQCNTKVINRKIGAPLNYKYSDRATIDTDENDEFNEYRLDAKLLLFSWNSVNVSDWYRPSITNTIPIMRNFTTINIVNDITFPVEINKNAHFILENGIVLDPSEYSIDPENSRRIILKNVAFHANHFVDEFLRDIASSPSFYSGMNPMKVLSLALTQKSYSLINFSNEAEDGKELYMKRSISCCTNYPYVGEITFSNVDTGDLILFKGSYNRYEWVNKNVIKFGKFMYSYNDDENRIKEKYVQRIYFVKK